MPMSPLLSTSPDEVFNAFSYFLPFFHDKLFKLINDEVKNELKIGQSILHGNVSKSPFWLAQGHDNFDMVIEPKAGIKLLEDTI